MATQLNGRATHTGSAPRGAEDGPRSHTASVRQSRRPRYAYDLQGEVRVARLRLAWSWLDAGALYQALGAYGEMLDQYRGTPTASAAAEDLLLMAALLMHQGKWYTALEVIRRVGDGA